MSGHPHADLMAKAAEIAKTDKEWWKHFEVKVRLTSDSFMWEGIKASTVFFPELNYRLKPRFININGHQVPEPVREPLKGGDLYFVASTADGMFSATWDCGYIDSERLRAGIIHLTYEAAEAHIAALLSFTQK